MSNQSSPPELEFAQRHIALREDDIAKMLAVVGADSLEDLLSQAVPSSILLDEAPQLPPMADGKGAEQALSQSEALDKLYEFAATSSAVKPMQGLGYYTSFMPEPIARRVLENPAWYTAYTPYQAEIAQGRLEMIFNFQTMVANLAGLPMANASLLDEATAAAEAMTMLLRADKQKGRNRFLVDADIHPQTLDVLHTRADPLGIELEVSNDLACCATANVFGALLSYPGSSGKVADFSGLADKLANEKIPLAVCSDLLALCLLKSPGEQGASVVVGSSQRFGLPLGAGGPHAAFMAFKEEYVRQAPGRIVGLSKDQAGRPALRLALQTREQHIRRAKATSNICTAQVLPAVLAAAYAIYHGPDGLIKIAQYAHEQACKIATALVAGGFELVNDCYFDTLQVTVANPTDIVSKARELGLGLRELDGAVGISCSECTTDADVALVLQAFGVAEASGDEAAIPAELLRTVAILPQPVFARYRDEHGFIRYLQQLVSKDISLDRSMIPLGSCTMKLNSATEMTALSWPAFGGIHPFAPASEQEAIGLVADDLAQMLKAVTGFAGVSLQPNAGSQGEFAGLLTIRNYHQANGDTGRKVCLIPESAHGTNPASAVMAGMTVVNIAIDSAGEIDLDDLRAKASEHKDVLAALMITYPSTCGIYGADIAEICAIVHKYGGQVYLDGANFNALVGVAAPSKFGADVMHINLHKTFCIPHGGGGPGMGPILCGEHLEPFLPGHNFGVEGVAPSGAVSAAPLGSGLLLIISWAYMRMMGAAGLRKATAVAVLAANYMAKRLEKRYRLAYQGANGRVAHEFVLDAREFKASAGITVEDIAKRLIDFGFHAPTVSFPLAGSVMVEPTESEPLEEIDRYVDALHKIKDEIDAIEAGQFAKDDNPLLGAPHPACDLLTSEYSKSYPAEVAAYPLDWVARHKYWPPISRVDQVFGDRNLVCVLADEQEL